MLRKNALVAEQSGRTEGNSPGRKSWVRRCRECEVPWGRHEDLSSPGDLSCAVNSTQDLRPGLFPSVLPDCSAASQSVSTIETDVTPRFSSPSSRPESLVHPLHPFAFYNDSDLSMLLVIEP